MDAREKLLAGLAAAILRLPAANVLRIAIDGVDGAGKTTFGDELAEAIQPSGRNVIRASVDGFHNPGSIRYRLGKGSAEGFFRDSYDYDLLKGALLDPLSPGGSGKYRTAAFDHRSDSPVEMAERYACAGSILIIDGIFLHRPELRNYWDFSIFLEVGFHISIPRGAHRGEGSADPASVGNRRYVEGQGIYLRACEPRTHATVIINNEDMANPRIITRSLTLSRPFA